MGEGGGAARPAWVRVERPPNFGYSFAVKEERVVRADQTLSFGGETLLVRSKNNLSKNNLAGQRVNVHRVPEGDLVIYVGKQRLEHRVLEHKPKRLAIPSPPLPAREAKGVDAAAQARKRAWLLGSDGDPGSTKQADKVTEQ